jgi:hypothetical protein
MRFARTRDMPAGHGYAIFGLQRPAQQTAANPLPSYPLLPADEASAARVDPQVDYYDMVEDSDELFVDEPTLVTAPPWMQPASEEPRYHALCAFDETGVLPRQGEAPAAHRDDEQRPALRASWDGAILPLAAPLTGSDPISSVILPPPAAVPRRDVAVSRSTPAGAMATSVPSPPIRSPRSARWRRIGRGFALFAGAFAVAFVAKVTVDRSTAAAAAAGPPVQATLEMAPAVPVEASREAVALPAIAEAVTPPPAVPEAVAAPADAAQEEGSVKAPDAPAHAAPAKVPVSSPARPSAPHSAAAKPTVAPTTAPPPKPLPAPARTRAAPARKEVAAAAPPRQQPTPEPARAKAPVLWAGDPELKGR